MTTDDSMNIHERYKYLRLMQPQYRAASRTEQSALLDTMQVLTQLDRKTLIRLLGSDLKRRPRAHERGATYGRDVDQVLRVVAESHDYICAERLAPNLRALAEHLAAHGELTLTPSVRDQLEAMSVASVYRHGQRLQQDEPRVARQPPAAPNEVARTIPMKRIAWDEKRPGHFEVDLVHHAGERSDGQYTHTLQMLDVATGWSERAAVLGRSYLVMEDGFRRCQARLPFAVAELHPDNGTEFLNDLMVKLWREKARIPELSRSRPYQKNDNRFVEQKNDSLVRAYVGHVRLDTVRQTILLNLIYDRLWVYNNFFQPVLRLAEKEVVTTADGHRIQRHFDQAQTPFDRLCACGVLAAEPQAALIRLREQTNPRQLRMEIYDWIEQLLSLPNAPVGKTEMVARTLQPVGCWSFLQPFVQPHPDKPTETPSQTTVPHPPTRIPPAKRASKTRR